jgi:hypothetical protein
LAGGWTRRIAPIGGGEPNGPSDMPSLNGDGSAVAFVSTASNFVAGDTNGVSDVFFGDVPPVPILSAQFVVLVSRSSSGTQGNGPSIAPAAAQLGGAVAYLSDASNLVMSDKNGVRDAFVTYVGGGTGRISTGNVLPSYHPSLSGDGRMVAFESASLDITPDDSNGHVDVFVRDQSSGSVEIVSVANDGSAANGDSLNPSMSRDGNRVAFISTATNLTPPSTASGVFVRDRLAQTTTLVAANGLAPAISGDGQSVAFIGGDLVPSDTNKHRDAYVENLQTHTLERASVGPGGGQINDDVSAVAISNDGRYVAFVDGPFLVPGTTPYRQVYLRDRTAGTTILVSVPLGTGLSFPNLKTVSVSDDGRYVAFGADWAGTGPSGPTGHDVILYDRTTNTTTIVSQPGSSPTTISDRPSLSSDGHYLSFNSDAAFTADDTNTLIDTYVADTTTRQLTRVSTTETFDPQDGNSFENSSISADGKYVAFASAASNLNDKDRNTTFDVYVAAVQRPIITSISPSTVARPGTYSIELTGVELTASTTFSFQDDGPTITNVTITDATHAHATLTVPATINTGPYSLDVTDTGGAWKGSSGSTATCTNCIHIT